MFIKITTSSYTSCVEGYSNHELDEQIKNKNYMHGYGINNMIGDTLVLYLLFKEKWQLIMTSQYQLRQCTRTYKAASYKNDFIQNEERFARKRHT